MDGPPSSSLMLDNNPYLQWCFKRLQKQDLRHPTEKVFKALQLPAIYAACRAVKARGEDLEEAARFCKCAQTFKWVTRSMLVFYKECGFPVPDWLTPEFMAKTTLNETGCGFADDGGKSGKLWKRYMETLRILKRDAIPFYNL